MLLQFDLASPVRVGSCQHRSVTPLRVPWDPISLELTQLEMDFVVSTESRTQLRATWETRAAAAAGTAAPSQPQSECTQTGGVGHKGGRRSNEG